MRQTRRRRAISVTAAGLAAAATVLGAAAASQPALESAAPSGAAAGGPTIRLIAAQKSVTGQLFGKQVHLDPGIWVAALGAPLRLNVERPRYTRPVTATQVISTPQGTTLSRRLPDWTVRGWNGLRDFARVTVRNSHGKVAASSKITFCPDGYQPQRTGPGSATTSQFPEECNPGDPFGLGTVWGIARGWAVDPTQYSVYRLALGTYRVTETVLPAYARFFHISYRDARAKVTVHVVKTQQGCCIAAGSRRPATGRPLGRPLASLPRVPLLRQAPGDALPDLVALPSWGITTSATKKSHQDYLNFGATVWVGGTSPLDVEGFRKPGSPTVRAYQYFWKNGRIVGRVRAGTMGFDNKKGHHHWHFQQFARYQLLSASRKVAVRSQKVGFCIAPTDAVNLLLPRATWQPS